MQRLLVSRFLMVAGLFAASSSVLAAEVTVSAAASLTNAFKEIVQSYEGQYPGARVALNFGASGALLQQIAKGAPVDVFAAADQETMNQAEKQGLVKPGERHDFVRNSLVVVVPAGATADIRRIEDLGQGYVKRIAISAPASVPAGRYAKHALEVAGLWNVVEPKAISTQNVRQSLDYVSRGEVDAGFVYATDAAILKDKVHIAFTVPLDMPIRYPIATLGASTNPAEARRFVGFVLSPSGQAILAKFGFGKP